MCITCSIFVIKCTEIRIVSYLSQDRLVNLHEIWLHTHDIYLSYRVKHFDENHSSFRGYSSLFHLHSMHPERFSIIRKILTRLCPGFIDLTGKVILRRQRKSLSISSKLNRNISCLSRQERANRIGLDGPMYKIFNDIWTKMTMEDE